jgi:hypothetical protein
LDVGVEKFFKCGCSKVQIFKDVVGVEISRSRKCWELYVGVWNWIFSHLLNKRKFERSICLASLNQSRKPKRYILQKN